MTEIGTVIDGKYEILKQIGKGGMSIVYLAMDKHLNKQWAVKEIRKRGNGKNDEVVVNSLLAEANLMKRLDHPALPRIVDIIDNGVTIYVVMDYIEGESLDKILAEFGAQSEELVITWAKQLCDALSYLHSQKPSIIYRDMKPANIMLKPEGNIKIIDFGIAREYKEQNLADTTVLGTKGYAPPEQYSGQTDPRSDIFALGMTMHHLLTGIDPRNGEPYAPVRAWNPNLSEGIELIIDKCVEPAAENRYQSCADLLYDLEHPELITSGYKKKQKKKLWAFLISSILCVVMAVSGVVLNFSASNMNKKDFSKLMNTGRVEDYYSAISIYPDRIEPYQKLVDYCSNTYDANNLAKSKDTVQRALNIIDDSTSNKYLDINSPEVARLYYSAGKLIFACADEENQSIKNKYAESHDYFKKAVDSTADFDEKEVAECYNSICNLMNDNSATKDITSNDFLDVFKDIRKGLSEVRNLSGSDAAFDRYNFYYASLLFINDNINKMHTAQVSRNDVYNIYNDIMNEFYSSPAPSSNKIALFIKDYIDTQGDYDDINERYTNELIEIVYAETAFNNGGV